MESAQSQGEREGAEEYLHTPGEELEGDRILPQLFEEKEKKTARLRMRNREYLEVRHLGEDYYGAYNGRRVWCPIYSYEALDWLVSEIHYAVAHGWDQPIVIAGRERSGKSDFAMHLVHKLDPNFDLSRITWTQDQFMRAVFDANPLDVVWMDEAGEAVFAQEWYTREQRSLIKAFLRFGIKRLTAVLVIPHMMLINKQLRERRVWWWIEVYARDLDERGYAQIRKAPLKQDPFRTETFWRGVFTVRFPPFKKVDPEKWRQYEEIKWKHLDKAEEEVSGIDAIIRKLLGEGRGIEETANILGIDVKRVRKVARDMRA